MKTRKRSGVFFFTSIVLILAIAYLCFAGIANIGGYQVKNFDQMIKKGLDLRGGVSVTEQIVSDKKVDSDTLNRTLQLLNSRVNKLGVSETAVVKEGSDRIRIDIPGEKDTSKVLNEIAKTGKLEFRAPDKSVILTGDDIKDATAGLNQESGGYEISLTLKDSGTKKFADATQKYIGQQISIYMDEDMLTNPKVNQVISNGKASISGPGTLEEYKRQADIIKSGALPVTLKNISANVVGATLGSDAYPQSIKAGVVGIAIVMLFMFLYYRIPGLIADFALLLFVLLVLGAFTVVGVTLSLSGIAGFLLTVGMAVDANVLIFERTKEELKSGKSVKTSINEGFKRAFTSILDSNMTTLITGIILYNLGSGSVKGFALTLIIGIIFSMFTAVVVTRQLMKWAADMGFFNNPASIGTFGVHDMRRGVEK